ncbi:MAG: hypothetical protein KBS52_06800 [Clostridiales bacterium]|nr:hypothetical protein [Candidatus Equinaster intestinalis]
MKRIIVFVLLIFLFCLPVSAQESIYSDMYDLSGLESAENCLPKEAKSILERGGITPDNSDWYEKIEMQSVFKTVWEIAKGGFEKPLKNAAVTAALILISALASCFSRDNESGESFGYFFSVIICAVVLKNVFYLVTASVNAIKGGATFMLGVVPVFTGVAAMSGRAVSTAAASGMILLAAQAVSSLCAFVIVPLMSAYLAIGVASSVSPLADSGIAESLKKIATWIIGLVSTLFIGLLSVQTAVNSAADSLRLKTAKFLVGSLVPAVGTALGEAVTTLSGSVTLLKSTVGIYAVFGVGAVLLPIIAELAAWRITLWLLKIMSTSFSLKKVDAVFGSIDSVLSVLMGITAFIGAVFVISLGIVVGIK